MLRTDYKDDILAAGQTNRKYIMTNSGGYVSFTDATTYQVVGDTFGAAVINETNETVNKCKEYKSGILPAGNTTITITDTNGFFDEDGNVEVYVPGAKVQDLVVKSTTLTNTSVTIVFSSSVGTDSEIRVICK